MSSKRWLVFFVAAAALAFFPACASRSNDAPASFDALSARDPLDALSWLEGSWTRNTKRGVSVETWTRVSSATMEGIVTLTQGDVSGVTESLRLEWMGEDVFYVAKPRENDYPTAFRLVEHDNGRFVFQNPAHDFPQQITYTQTAGNALVVEISRIAEAGKGIAFKFERLP